MSKRPFLLLSILAALAWPGAAQVFDNTGNSLLSGNYYFREVVLDFADGFGAIIYGSINFGGNGTYAITAIEGDTNSGTLQNYSVSGTYSISASGFGFLSNQLLNSPVYGTISNGIFIGSGTESGVNDLFIAVPIASQNAGTLQGSYSISYIDPTGELTGGIPYDAFVQMSPNGSGGIGTVNLSAYATSSSPTNQSISGVKYTVSNNAFVLAFPTGSNSALLQGTEYLYASPDGSFVFGGSPTNFDMFVGVRNGSSGNNFGGLYYQAGLDEDVSQLASTGGVGLDTYYGSFSASNGVLIGHERVQPNAAAQGFTYVDSYPQGTNGTYNDAFLVENYTGGNGGTVRVGYGIGPSLGISVAVQAPNFSGSGVYLNPTGVVNAASSAPFTAGVSPGELLTLVGTNLGPSRLQVASSVPFPTTLGNVQVLINNIAAPIYYVSANQISAIVPYEITTSIAQIQVVNSGTTSNAVTEFVNLTTPGVFTEPAGGVGYAAALHPDFSLVTPNSPAQIGETVAVFVTGLGQVFPTIADGAAGAVDSLSNAITADISGVTTTVAYAGLAPGLAGLYQINIAIPVGVSAGDNYVDIAGPDSYASEALISIADPGSAVQAKLTQPEIRRQHNSATHFLPHLKPLAPR